MLVGVHAWIVVILIALIWILSTPNTLHRSWTWPLVLKVCTTFDAIMAAKPLGSRVGLSQSLSGSALDVGRAGVGDPVLLYLSHMTPAGRFG
jgi:hypothetical protein